MTTPLERIKVGAFSLAGVIVLSMLGIHFVGGYDWLESLWLVVVTISTVGYGESSQLSPAMQLITIGIIVLGVTAAAYTCGGFIQLALEGEVNRALGRRKMTNELKRMKDHVIVCGFGRLGQDLAKQLGHRHVSHVIIDIDSDKTSLAEEYQALFVLGDATSEDILEQAGVERARALVTALPTDAENVFITLTARNMDPDIQIISKSEHESSCRKLRQAGANKIVMPHRVGAQQMERMISRPTTATLVELFAEASHLDMELDEFILSENSSLVGDTIGHSRLRDDFNLLVVGIKNSEGTFHFNPGPEATMEQGDTVLVMGQVDDINRMKTTYA